MSDEDSGPGEFAPPAPLAPDAPPVFSSVYEAARALSAARQTPEQTPVEAAKAPPEEPELAKADADPETDPGETKPEVSETEEEVLPAIERPRSWSKDVDEEWSSYPREAQVRIVQREQERDTAVRRAQNEVAEERKALKAERESAQQIQAKYEAKLPLLEKKLATVGPFADIQSMDDLKNLQRNDPFRFQEYQLYHWEQQAEQAELQAAQQRNLQEKQTKRASYETEQNKLLVDLVPEMADPKTAAPFRERAITMLNDDFNLSTDQLSRWMETDVGHEILSNASIQKLIADGMKLRDIQKAKTIAAPKTLPPVARPGTSKGTRLDVGSQIRSLQSQIDKSSGMQAMRLGAELMKLKRSA